MRAYVVERLEERGWSGRDLAREAGLAHTTVIQVLNGQARPGLRFYVGVAKALQVSVDRLLELAGEMPASGADDEAVREYARGMDEGADGATYSG